jgi:cbb3-type cytochrome oxidase subunit 3
MDSKQKDASLETLQEIRAIMERSARLLSLSGWSGIWAGCIALIGALLTYSEFGGYYLSYNERGGYTGESFQQLRNRLLLLAAIVFVLALLGGYYFTYRKNKKSGISIWNAASRKMLTSLFIPLGAGAILTLSFIVHNDWVYVAPSCLIFYGLSLINAGKYTLTDIKYLGLSEVILGCLGLFFPGWGLSLWAIGFGLLHIMYGIIMWRKYDRQ